MPAGYDHYSNLPETLQKVIPDLTTQAQIGDSLLIDVILSRETGLTSQVTTNPVEDGFVVADHVTREAITLSMECIFTPTPVYWDVEPDPNRLATVARELLKIYEKADPITITLPDAIYENMVMTSAPLPRRVEDGVCYRLQLEFVQVRRVQQKSEIVGANTTSAEASGMAGQSEKDAGAASQEDIGSGFTIKTSNATIAKPEGFETYSDFEDVTTPEKLSDMVAEVMAADKANAGGFSTFKELTANATVQAMVASLIWGL